MKLADYSQVVTVDELDGALHAGGFDGVFHYLGDDFAFREEDPLIVAGIRARGWAQGGIFVPSLARVAGAGDAQRQLSTYGYPVGSVAVLDIEPIEFDQDPVDWANAADGWCVAIRAAGLRPWVYGVDRTVAACGNGADAIMRAVPGMCDPAAPGPQGLNPAFKPGQRAVQCDQGVWNGVSMDSSISEVSLMTTVNIDPADAVAAGVQQLIKGQADAWTRLDSVFSDVESNFAWPNGTVLRGLLADIKAAVAGITPGTVDVAGLAAALATHQLTATLSDAERDAIAAHVLQHLARDAAAG